MSLKPSKKSDQNKAWLEKRADRYRKIQPEYHLIVTEGTNTEPAYFGAIRDIINQNYRHKLQLRVSGEGDNTLSLFRKAQELAEGNANIFRHVWVVYDTDDFPAEHVNQVVALCRESSTEETEYHAIWSNQCIELWYLLHFSFLQSDLHRSEYFPKLTECLTKIGAGKYKKNRSDMYYLLRPHMDIALTNARKLAEINGEKFPSLAAPGTRVYEIVETLKPYL